MEFFVSSLANTPKTDLQLETRLLGPYCVTLNGDGRTLSIQQHHGLPSRYSKPIPNYSNTFPIQFDAVLFRFSWFLLLTEASFLICPECQ